MLHFTVKSLSGFWNLTKLLKLGISGCFQIGFYDVKMLAVVFFSCPTCNCRFEWKAGTHNLWIRILMYFHKNTFRFRSRNRSHLSGCVLFSFDLFVEVMLQYMTLMADGGRTRAGKSRRCFLEVFLHVHFKPGNLQSQETRRFFHLADLLT